MKAKTMSIAVGLLGLFSTLVWSPADAQAQDRVEQEVNRGLAYWQDQADAAERDTELVRSVQVAYISARVASTPDAAAIDRALAPLRAVYEHRSLRYRSLSDHCGVRGAINEAYRHAANRHIDALQKMSLLHKLNALYASIRMQFAGDALRGRPPSIEAVRASFLHSIEDEPREHRRLDFRDDTSAFETSGECD